MIKIGVLGAGRVVQNRYVDVFLNELKNAEVTTVADIVAADADKVSQQLGCRPVYSLEELVCDKNVDVVLVATESGNHQEHVMAALDGGKHVIVEKPPAMLAKEVITAQEFAKQKNLMYAVIFQNRLNPAMRILKETFESGRFGKIVLATIRLRWCRYQDYYEDGWHGTWDKDGGVINQQAIHHLDAMQWVCGPITDVCCAQNNALNSLEAEDTTVAIVRFANGFLGAIEATTAARPEDFEASMSVVGEKGMAVIGGIALNNIETWQFVEEELEDKTIPKDYSQEVPTGYGLSHGPLMQEIVDRLSQGRLDPPITGSDCIPVVDLVHGLYCSVEQGGWVSIANRPVSARLGKKKQNNGE